VNGTADRDVAVLEMLRVTSATRPQIAVATRMSKPTVSAAIAHLERLGLVHSDGQATGTTGRKPTVYALNRTARLVVGIDIGGVNTRVAIADLCGTILAETTAATAHDQVTEQVVTMFRQLRSRVLRKLAPAHPPLASAVLSTPGLVVDSSRVWLAYNVDSAGVLDFTPMARKLKVPLRVENNVNVAAIGEMRFGAAVGHSSFVYLSVGAGIGVGTVHDGELLRGAHGAAGEISYLPLGSHPLDKHQALTGNFEETTAASGLLARAQQETWPGHAPDDVAELFRWAAEGDPIAMRLVRDQGSRIGLAVVAARTIIDPELVVLGGGIGRNELLIDPVTHVCQRLLPVPCPVVTTALADRGSLVGAVTAASDDAWRSIVDSASSVAAWASPAPSSPPKEGRP
jgi:predicted NBD/HSP70 family sugar kinase